MLFFSCATKFVLLACNQWHCAIIVYRISSCSSSKFLNIAQTNWQLKYKIQTGKVRRCWMHPAGISLWWEPSVARLASIAGERAARTGSIPGIVTRASHRDLFPNKFPALPCQRHNSRVTSSSHTRFLGGFVYLISTCVCIVDRSSMRVGVCVCGVRRMFRYYSLYSKWRALKKKKEFHCGQACC
jgi:hypothetical protein